MRIIERFMLSACLAAGVVFCVSAAGFAIVELQSPGTESHATPLDEFEKLSAGARPVGAEVAPPELVEKVNPVYPEEMRAARWMVRERESFVARTNEKARELLERAKQRSDELVTESYIVKEAVDEANALVRQAEGEATRIRLEAEDYSEQAFEQTEGVLADLLSQVRRFRGELHQARHDPRGAGDF